MIFHEYNKVPQFKGLLYTVPQLIDLIHEIQFSMIGFISIFFRKTFKDDFLILLFEKNVAL